MGSDQFQYTYSTASFYQYDLVWGEVLLFMKYAAIHEYTVDSDNETFFDKWEPF